MAGWHHWLDGRESEWTPGDGDGQGALVCCNSWGCKESDPTEWLNWIEYSHSCLIWCLCVVFLYSFIFYISREYKVGSFFKKKSNLIISSFWLEYTDHLYLIWLLIKLDLNLPFCSLISIYSLCSFSLFLSNFGIIEYFKISPYLLFLGYYL